MIHVKRKLLLVPVALAAAAGLAPASPAHADDDGSKIRNEDNFAVAINTTDASLRWDFSWELRRERDEVVDNQNVAFAQASCIDCRTRAIAVQIVLVEGSPSTVTPLNLSLSVNENCTGCETFTGAGQFVRGGGARLKLTDEGRVALAQIKQETRALTRADLSPAELDARFDALMDRVDAVLDTELVTAHADDGEDEDSVETDFADS